MATYLSPNLAGNPFPLPSLYIPLSALWPVLGDRDSHKPSFCRGSLVHGQVVCPLGIFLGNGFLVGDGRVWNCGCNFAPLPNKLSRHSLRNKEISPKIIIVKREN